jgi:hypothetical protein
MGGLRKVSDIWKAIDDQRLLAKMGKNEWRQSFKGVKAAIEYIGLKIVTTKEELDTMEIPMDKKRIKKYGHRNIKVSKNGIISKSIRIYNILDGNNGLKTDEEIIVINKKRGISRSIYLPKGVCTSHNFESKAVDDLDILIDISTYTHRVHLFELRLFDIAYCLFDDDVGGEFFVADQVKTSKVCKNGLLCFNYANRILTVGTMISILKNGSLTCIGKNQDNKVDVVWFFYGIDAVNVLKKFNIKQGFHPRLHLTINSYNEFTIAMNNPILRFEVGKSSEECHRLLEKKIEYIKTGIKHSLTFWNEDDSQIPSKTNRIEQRSFNMTRYVCKCINIKVERVHENSYGPVDFIINGIVRVQDKVATTQFHIRNIGRHPYNPDDIDIFQVSDLVNNIVYAIPMRIIKDNVVISFFTTRQLMKETIWFGLKWKENHKQFKYDFKNNEDILSYVKACEDANKIPKITDKKFYTNMIDENKDQFGSKKQLKAIKENVH